MASEPRWTGSAAAVRRMPPVAPLQGPNRTLRPDGQSRARHVQLRTCRCGVPCADVLATVRRPRRRRPVRTSGPRGSRRTLDEAGSNGVRMRYAAQAVTDTVVTWLRGRRPAPIRPRRLVSVGKHDAASHRDAARSGRRCCEAAAWRCSTRAAQAALGDDRDVAGRAGVAPPGACQRFGSIGVDRRAVPAGVPRSSRRRLGPARRPRTCSRWSSDGHGPLPRFRVAQPRRRPAQRSTLARRVPDCARCGGRRWPARRGTRSRPARRRSARAGPRRTRSEHPR